MEPADDRGQDEARLAIQERVGRATLFMVGGQRRKLANGVASATLLETPAGRLVGVQADWSEDRHVLLFDPSDRWHAWFRSVLGA